MPTEKQFDAALREAAQFEAEDKIRDGELINAFELVFFFTFCRVGADLYKLSKEAYHKMMGSLLFTQVPLGVGGKGGGSDPRWYQGMWLWNKTTGAPGWLFDRARGKGKGGWRFEWPSMDDISG